MNNLDSETTISFIYFDVGGVIIKDFSDADLWEDFKQKGLGIKPEQLDAFERVWDTISPRVCLDYDVDDLLPTLNRQISLSLPEDFSILNQFIIRFQQNKSLWPILETIQSKGIKIGLLTNMYPRMFAAIQDAQLLPQIDWDQIIDSSKEKLKKPDPAFFSLAQSMANTSAEEILFVDNTQKHLDAAQTIGWHTHYYNSANYSQATQDLVQYLHQIGI